MTSRQDDDSLRRCWRQQSCSSCLHTQSCNWCPFTQSCTPNTYAIPLLAPAYDENICPHWAERWEVRTRPLGCQVSTITALSVIISVISTAAVIGLIWLIVLTTKRLKRRLTSQQQQDWWGARDSEQQQQTWLAYALGGRIWDPREWEWGNISPRRRTSGGSGERDPLLNTPPTARST